MKALIFYADHFPGTFIEFQKRYLDDAFVKFFSAKGFGSFVREDDRDCDSSDSDCDSEESTNRFLPSVFELCNSAGIVARKLSADEQHPDPKWTHDPGLGVYVHPRFGGSVLVLGKIGDEDAVFGYCPSKRHELPCCADECLLGTKSWDWGAETREIMEKYRCEKMGIITEFLTFSDGKKKRKRELVGQELNDGEVYWIDDGDDLEQFLGKEVPADLKDALKAREEDSD